MQGVSVVFKAAHLSCFSSISWFKLSFAVVLFWFLCLRSFYCAAETNTAAIRPAAAGQSAPKPQDLAAAYERAGRKRDAAALYEEMVRTNTTARKVLSQRLVLLYIETGETNKALAWAREVMRSNPDPQAYLAGVYARLGQWKEAQQTLETEIARATNTTRAVTLRWQLAGVHLRQGATNKAQDTLSQAVNAARGTSMESASKRRLDTVKGGAE